MSLDWFSAYWLRHQPPGTYCALLWTSLEWVDKMALLLSHWNILLIIVFLAAISCIFRQGINKYLTCLSCKISPINFESERVREITREFLETTISTSSTSKMKISSVFFSIVYKQRWLMLQMRQPEKFQIFLAVVCCLSQIINWLLLVTIATFIQLIYSSLSQSTNYYSGTEITQTWTTKMELNL